MANSKNYLLLLLSLSVVLLSACAQFDDGMTERPPLVYSSTYFVATDGSDSNDGLSAESAYGTINHAVERLDGSSGIINILPGEYHEEIMADGCEEIVIQGMEGVPVLDGERDKALGLWFTDCRDVVVRNLEIRNYTDIGIGAEGGSDVTFSDLIVHDNGFAVQYVDWEIEGYGIDIDTVENVYIYDSDVYHNGPSPQISPDFLMGTGINVYGCNHCVIEGNLSHGNIGGGMLVEDSFDVLVDANEVYENDLDATEDGWWDGGLWLDGGGDVVVSNNIFRDNLGPGIEISDEDLQEPTGYVLENNLSTGNYYGIFIWNFGSEEWPAEDILKVSNNRIEKNSRQDVLIDVWGCPSEDQPCE